MAEIVNGRCHAEKAPLESPSLIQNGRIVLQYHHIGWIVSSVLTLVAMGVSFWLINKHVRWYTNKHEQRYIVRILFMVPLYAVISTASYFWWNHSTPLLLLRDCYESTVLTAFFYLLLLYVSPDPHEQKEIFRKNGLSRENDRERRRRGEPIQKWVFPLNVIQSKPTDGLYFLQMMKWGVLQYCVVRPGTTLAAVILDYVGLYCEDSWGLGWGHAYITIVVSISVSIAMYCLIQLYMVVKVELAPQKPLLKLFAIKAVVFLTFWQATFLSVLTVFGLVKDTPYMTADNINIGIGAILETFEMALFACLHIKAFSYKPYCIGDPTPRWRSLAHAMNFKETGRELWQGMVYMIRRSRGYEVDTQARREAALENVFGRSRFDIYREANASSNLAKATASEKDLGVSVQVEKEVRVGDERQWLGVGDDYVYGLGYQTKRQRERSEGLESQIEKELAKRGYTMRDRSPGGAYAPIIDEEVSPPTHQRAQASWWRRVYNRISQSGQEVDDGPSSSPNDYPPPRQRSSSRRRSRDPTGKAGLVRPMADVQEDDYNDPPPPSAIRTYRESRNKRQGPKRKAAPTLDPPLLFASFGVIPSPLSSPEPRKDTRIVAAASNNPPDHSLLAPHVFAAGMLAPLLSPSAQSSKADSFLDRAFAGSVEPGSSVDVLSTGVPSSQSHQGHVRLGPVPVIEPQSKPPPKTPVVVHPAVLAASTSGPSNMVVDEASAQPFTIPSPPLPIADPRPRPSLSTPSAIPHFSFPPQSPPPAVSPDRSVPALWTAEASRDRRRSSHRRDSAQFFPEPGSPSVAQRQSPPRPQAARSPPQSPPHLQRTTAAYSRGVRRNSGSPGMPSPQYTPQLPSINKYTPTRDRIVLPAPLAPGAPSSPPVATSTPPQVFSNPRYSPPGLPVTPSHRRSMGPRSPPYSNLPR